LTNSNPGELVIDPVLGSGTTLRVCLRHGRRCIGVEVNLALEERIGEKIENIYLAKINVSMLHSINGSISSTM